MWLFYKTGFQKQMVCQLSGWIVYKWGCAITAHPHLFCVRFADRSYLYVTGFLSETSYIPYNSCGQYPL